MTQVVVLRPEPGASETVARAKALGLEIVSRPLFDVEALDWAMPDAGCFDALLLTSANAVRHGGDKLPRLWRLPVHAVGDATANAAREAGFDIASVSDAGIDRLLGSIAPDLRLLHLCGEDRKAPEDAAQAITAIPVYRAREIGLALKDLGDAVALIHSPRAGRRFAELIQDRSTIAIAAISPAAADATGDGWKWVEPAEHPTDAALLALAARLCNTLPAT